MKQVFAFEKRRRDVAPKKNRVWYYHWPDEMGVELKKGKGKWLVNKPKSRDQVSFTKLTTAKSYITNNGGEVWNELIDIKK